MSDDIRDMIRRLDRMESVMGQQLLRAMTASLLAVERDARELAPQDTRRLSGSITHRIDGEGLRLVGHVGPSVRYGRVMEFGRRAGATMPPVAALIPWVKRHWRPPLVGNQMVLGGWEGEVRSTNRRAFRASRRRNESSEMFQARIDRMLLSRAWALAVAISRRGIRPRAYMRQAYGKNQAQIYTNFRSVGARVLASLAGRQL